MVQVPPPKTVLSLAQKSYQAAAANVYPSLIILALLFVLPQIIFRLSLAHSGFYFGDALRKFAENQIYGGDLLMIVRDFLSPFVNHVFYAALILTCAHAMGYSALLLVFSRYFRGTAPLDATQAISMSLRKLPRMLLGLGLVFSAFLFTQWLLPILLIVAIPTLMVPVLIIFEDQGVFRSFVNSIQLSYGKAYGVLSLVVHIMTVGLLFYLGLGMVFQISFLAGELDLFIGLERDFFSQHFDGSPLGLRFLILTIWESSATAALFGVLATALSTLYHLARAFERPLPVEGIRT